MSIDNILNVGQSQHVEQFQPKNISCVECESAFIFSTEEQEFYRSQGFTNSPKRCPHCRILTRMRREGKSTHTVTQLNCAECGKKTTVPFLPNNEKEIYCITCLNSSKKSIIKS